MAIFRIGTGEITDSLALEPYIGLLEVVPFFAEQPNVLLELKTKSDCVDGLLDLDPKERVSGLLVDEPQRVIAQDEHGTATLDERLRAARRCKRRVTVWVFISTRWLNILVGKGITAL